VHRASTSVYVDKHGDNDINKKLAGVTFVVIVKHAAGRP